MSFCHGFPYSALCAACTARLSAGKVGRGWERDPAANLIWWVKRAGKTSLGFRVLIGGERKPWPFRILPRSGLPRQHGAEKEIRELQSWGKKNVDV